MAIIELVDVHKIYTRETEVQRSRCRFEIASGEFASIIGPLGRANLPFSTDWALIS